VCFYVSDISTFDEFYRGTSRRLVRYAYGLTGDLRDAQDFAQEAYVRAWQRWSKLTTYDNAEAWLRLVVTRLATDRWRSRAVRARRAAEPPPPSIDDAALLDAVELVNVMRQLPVDHRRALAMHYLLDLPIADIAAETGVAVGTVKSWLSRGRAALAEALSPNASTTGGYDA
jgi:RNA polymerase sigma-70 factor (ECF subfamily)